MTLVTEASLGDGKPGDRPVIVCLLCLSLGAPLRIPCRRTIIGPGVNTILYDELGCHIPSCHVVPGRGMRPVTGETHHIGTKTGPPGVGTIVFGMLKEDRRVATPFLKGNKRGV